MVTRYKQSRLWKRLPVRFRSVRVERIHNWTAYGAFALVLLHPVMLTLDSSTKFSLLSILVPSMAPVQPLFVSLGVLSFYALLIVICSSQKFVRKRIGFRIWKNIHLVSYGTAVLVCIHGIFLDPELKSRQPDFLDGEKLLCEACLLILIIGMTFRLKRYMKMSGLKKSVRVPARP